MKRFILLTVLCAALPLYGCAQKKAPVPEFSDWYTTPEDSLLAEKILDGLKSMDADVPQMMIAAGNSLLGNEYVANTLEGGEREQVRVFLKKTDCILFVETCFNLAEAVKIYGDDANFAHFADLVRQSRYRDGVVTGYSDRVHYTTEWIRQQEARGLVEDLTEELGGEVYDDPIDFMSTHPQSYEHLRNAESDPVQARDLEVIAEAEKRLNSQPFSYIPQERISSVEGDIRTGDIIGYMSATKGLDIAHVVIAYVHWPDGTVIYGPHDMEASAAHGGAPVVGFMHASSGKMKVIVDALSINDYANSSKGINGIKVVRPL